MGVISQQYPGKRLPYAPHDLEFYLSRLSVRAVSAMTIAASKNTAGQAFDSVAGITAVSIGLFPVFDSGCHH